MYNNQNSIGMIFSMQYQLTKDNYHILVTLICNRTIKTILYKHFSNFCDYK